jgi:hypothetical protein
MIGGCVHEREPIIVVNAGKRLPGRVNNDTRNIDRRLLLYNWDL